MRSHVKDEAKKLLAELLDVSKKSIDEALEDTKKYKKIQIPKRSGGQRTIYIPSENLKRIQRKIKNKILKRIWAYCPQIRGLYSGSYAKHADIHKSNRFFFQFDLKDAFPSADIGKLSKILFNNIKEKDFLFRLSIPPEFLKDTIDLIINLVTVNRKLPQGAPTSPFLFYISLVESRLIFEICKMLAEKLFVLEGFSAKTSCYVDNFLISAPKPISEKIRKEVFIKVEEAGFKVNSKKTRYQDFRNGSPMICGLRISEKIEHISGSYQQIRKIGLPRKTVRKWRAIIHQAQFKPELKNKVEGFIGSLIPVYGEYENIPRQIRVPYNTYLKSLPNSCDL